jgi:hypothetical protein
MSRHRASAVPAENPLIPVLKPFDHELRRALYAATNSGSLRRRTWNGCAFNRAAAILGVEVNHLSGAADAFQLPVQRVNDFITTWDRLRGSDGQCTELLRDALLAVGLFPDDVRSGEQAAASCALAPSEITAAPAS